MAPSRVSSKIFQKEKYEKPQATHGRLLNSPLPSFFRNRPSRFAEVVTSSSKLPKEKNKPLRGNTGRFFSSAPPPQHRTPSPGARAPTSPQRRGEKTTFSSMMVVDDVLILTHINNSHLSPQKLKIRERNCISSDVKVQIDVRGDALSVTY